MRQLMRAAILALTLVFSAGALAVCIEVSDTSRSELLTPSASEALENCLAPSVRADDESGTWRFIQVQRGGRGGGGYRGGYSAYRPPPSSSMSRSFNRAAAPRPPVVRPPAARPPIARAPTVRLGPSVSRIAPRPFARSVAPRSTASALSVRGNRAAPAVRLASRVGSRASTPRVAVRASASRAPSAVTARVSRPRAVMAGAPVRTTAVARPGGAVTRAGIARPVTANARAVASSVSTTRRSATAAPVQSGQRPPFAAASRVQPSGFAYATGKNLLVSKAALPNRLAGGMGSAAVTKLRTDPGFRRAEAKLHDRVARVGLNPANQSAKFVFDARAGRFRDTGTGRFVAHRSLPWPSNSGFASSSRGTIQAGKVLDRFGSPTGRFLGEPGASVSARGLPPGTDQLRYTRYKVVKPIEAEIGPAAAVREFGASGGAKQYLPKNSVQWLVDNGYLQVLR